MQQPNRNILMARTTGGFILVSMMMGILMVLSLTAMTLNQSTFMETRISANHASTIHTAFGQQAARAYAVWQLKNDPDWRTAANGEPFVFDGKTYTLKALTCSLGGYEDVVMVSAGLLGGTQVEQVGIRIAQPPDFLSVYFADSGNSCIRKINLATGIITTLAGQGTRIGDTGDGGPAIDALLSRAAGVVGDLDGNVIIADTGNNRIRRVDAITGIISPLVNRTGTVGTLGDNGPALDAQIKSPQAMDLDGNGHLFFTEVLNSCIRRVDATTGIITTVAGICGTLGYTGDGGLATAATMKKPEGVTVDSSGNVFISDTGNNCIRRVDATTGIITTLITGLQTPGTITADSQDNLFIADTGNAVIRKIDAATGTLTTVAGIVGSLGYNGDNIPATLAMIKLSAGALGFANGDIYISDTGNNRIRRVDGATGIITTLAGNGLIGFSGDGGPAVDAMLKGPQNIHYAPTTPEPVFTIVEEIY
ncbi:hypothetical protein [Desulfobacula sp.]|uniref:NHL domain-containing protein n=1 Tax=Desulfobacula sp. TaxID=2593537 RepID=UPI0026123046|nr:hypothetical protein [Desulfobacula sp.]